MLENILNTVIQQINITGPTNVTIPDLPVITLENAFGDLTSMLITLVLMAAITIRTGSEAIEKWYNGEITTFKPKYLITALIAFVGSLPLAMYLFPGAATIFVANYGTAGLIGTLVIVGFYGYAFNHGVNKGTSLVGHFFNPSAKSNNTTTTTGGPPTN